MFTNPHYPFLSDPSCSQLKTAWLGQAESSVQYKSQFQCLVCFVFLCFLYLVSPSIGKHTDLLKCSLLSSKSKSFLILIFIFYTYLTIFLTTKIQAYYLEDSSNLVQSVTLGFTLLPEGPSLPTRFLLCYWFSMTGILACLIY